METHKRRQTILSLLKESGVLDVDELAARLGVSPNTIRNDFNALANEGLLQRVRGGAALRANGDSDLIGAGFAGRLQDNQATKEAIGRWAAELVEDNDCIMLDASTTVYYMAQHLSGCHNLTVVTNGVETARRLARDPTNTVLLLGGLLRQDGVPVSGLFTEQTLRELNIERAFVSCAGLTADGGLTEHDIREAQLKSRMVAAAGSVVALADSSKFGRTGAGVFARVQQVSQFFTDSQVSPEILAQLRNFGTQVTICSADSASTYSRSDTQDRHYVIGFANLSEQVPFAVEVRRSLERAAKEAGNVDLILADNELDEDVALRVADRLLAAKPDLIIEFQLHVRQGSILMEKFRAANVPVIAVDIPMIGATYFGADNYRAGHVAGVAMGEWIKTNWNGEYDAILVLEELRAGLGPGARIDGQIHGMASVLGPLDESKIRRLDSGNCTWVSEASTARVLVELGDKRRIAVLPFNDDSALGALAAARRLHRTEHVSIVGQGADRSLREEFGRPGSPIIGGTTYHPERYGGQLIPLALKILRGEPVPPAVHIQHTFIHAAPREQTQPTEAQ